MTEDRTPDSALRPAGPAAGQTSVTVTAIWAAGFALMLHFGWGRAGDIVIDSFHDLVTVMRLAAGEPLYTGIAYLYGPVGPTFLRGSMALFGLDVTAYLALCALLAAVELHLADRIARRFVAPAGRILLLVAVAGVFTFHSELFSRLMPYSFSALLAAVLYLAFLDRWLDARQGVTPAADGLVAGLVAGLLLHTKFEFGLAAAGVLAADFIVEGISRSESGRRSGYHLPALAGMALAAGAGFLLVPGLGGTVETYLQNVDPRPFLTSPAGAALARTAGAVTSWKALGNILGLSLYSFALLLVPAALILFLARRNLRVAMFLSATLLIPPAVRFVAGYPARSLDGLVPQLRLLADYTILTGVIPLLLLAVAGLAIGGVPGPERRTRLLLVVASAGLLVRTPASLSPGLFGSFYLLPAVVVAVSLSGEWLRWIVTARRRQSAGLVALGLLVFGVPGILANFQRFRLKGYAPAVSLLPFATDGVRARIFGEAIEFLAARTKPGDPLAVFPQEPVLYFATRTRPALPDHNFIAHVVRGDPMEDLVRRLEEARPEFVVVSNRVYREGGLGAFGQGYGADLQKVIARDYEAVARFGLDGTRRSATPATGALGDPYYELLVFGRKTAAE